MCKRDVKRDMEIHWWESEDVLGRMVGGCRMDSFQLISDDEK